MFFMCNKECGVCINVGVNSNHYFLCAGGERVLPRTLAFPCFATHARKTYINFSNVMMTPFLQTVADTSSLHHLLTRPFQFFLHVLKTMGSLQG